MSTLSGLGSSLLGSTETVDCPTQLRMYRILVVFSLVLIVASFIASFTSLGIIKKTIDDLEDEKEYATIESDGTVTVDVDKKPTKKQTLIAISSSEKSKIYNASFGVIWSLSMLGVAIVVAFFMSFLFLRRT